MSQEHLHYLVLSTDHWTTRVQEHQAQTWQEKELSTVLGLYPALSIQTWQEDELSTDLGSSRVLSTQ